MDKEMKITKSVHAEYGLWKKMEALAERQQTSLSAVMRQAMAEKIERESKNK